MLWGSIFNDWPPGTAKCHSDKLGVAVGALRPMLNPCIKCQATWSVILGAADGPVDTDTSQHYRLLARKRAYPVAGEGF
jgi:hypothetical protein